MKYKVGDKVVIRVDLDCSGRYERMLEFIGTTRTIKEVLEEKEAYLLEGDDAEWLWTDGMIEGLVEEVKKEVGQPDAFILPLPLKGVWSSSKLFTWKNACTCSSL